MEINDCNGDFHQLTGFCGDQNREFAGSNALIARH